MKKTYLLFFLLIILPSFIFSQVDTNTTHLIPTVIDSIQISIWDIQTKEVSLPDQKKEYQKEIGRAVLLGKDQELLINHLQDAASYDQTRALLYHHNIMFDVYHKGLIVNQIKISTITGNVDMQDTLGVIYFRNNCSQQLGKIVVDLLNKYELLKMFDEVDLEGIIEDKKE